MARASEGRGRKVALTLAILGLLASAAGFATYAAFFSTTSNAANSVAAGTVTIADNDAGSFMYQVTSAKPGDVIEKCITVTYTGSLDASVKIYTASSIGTLGQYLTLEITPGSFLAAPAFPSCTGFIADGTGAIFNNTLSNFASTHSTYSNGLADNPGSATKWVANDAVVYRFRLTVQDSNNAQGTNTGSHTFTWEAQNQ